MLRSPRNLFATFMKGAVLSAVAAGFMAAGAMAQDDNANDESKFTRRDNFQDWTLTCVAPKGTDVCQMVQVLANKDTKSALMRVQVRGIGDGKNVMIITLPLGVDLRKEAAMQIAEKQGVKMRYTMCLQDGCRLQFTMSDDVIAAMRAAPDKGTVIFGRPNAEKNIGLPISFKGFSEAYDALVKTEAQ